MIEVFEHGEVYAFSREKYIESMEDWTGGPATQINWPKDIDGEEVEVINENHGIVGAYAVLPQWCTVLGFDPEKRYVFSKEKYIKRRGKDVYSLNKSWVDRCDRQEVECLLKRTGFVKGCLIHFKWCEEVEQ